jgi:hypothetical protein
VKTIDEMSRDEILALIASEEKRRARAKAYHASHSRATLREKIARDPKAYLTRRKDYEEAERLGIDTKHLPKLNDI